MSPFVDIGNVLTHNSKFWHQILQSPLASNARALTNLLLPKSLHSTLLSRYMMNFLCFFFSGVSHAVSPLGSTLGSQQIHGTIFFFPAQVIGIMMEDLVMAAYKKVMGVQKGQQLGGWTRYVGWLWVGCFMSWCCPIWVYPTLRRGGEGMVPFSFIRMMPNAKEVWEF